VPPGIVPRQGTGVQLRLRNPLSPLLDPGYVEATLRRHFQPLFDPSFDEILTRHYPRGIAFTINGSRLGPEARHAPESAPIAVRLARKRKPSAAGYLVRDRGALAEEQRGLGISTFGKVIKRGWDWLGLTPAATDRVGGLVEVPALADCLTLNKADFIRTGSRGAVYLAYRKAIQEAVAAQLAAWGDLAEPGGHAGRRAARPVERDLESVLGRLAEDFPLLASLVERRAGGQRQLPIGREPGDGLGATGPVTPLETLRGEAPLATASTEPASEATTAALPATETAPLSSGAPDAAGRGTPTPMSTREDGRRQRARFGLAVQFAERPDDPELARLVESTVWVNTANAAYRRAAASRSEGYHLAVAVALALAPLAVEPPKEHGFLTAFLSAWGTATDRRKRRRTRSR
jgi:hypothetical protein